MSDRAPNILFLMSDQMGAPVLDLPRFGGHLTIWEGGIHHAENKTAVPAGLPASDG